MVSLKIFGVFFMLFLKLSFSNAEDCENLDCNKTSWIKIFELLEKYEISAEYESFQNDFDQQNQTLDNTTTFENNTSNSTAGEEREYAEIYDQIDLVQRIMFGIVIIFEVFTVLFFFNEFSKKESEFRGAYYVMLAVGMCTDIMGHTSELVQFYYYDKVGE
uniref:Uncharacterized protein n=1 Tax=Panagrolaimus sp. PS1159 TaxID=55785 RepID=A0AC35F271_9BILA